MKKLLILFFILAPVVLRAQTVPPPPPVANENTRDSVGIFERVEIEARFPGGDSAWREYLIKNFRVEKVSDDVLNSLSKKQQRKTSLTFTAIVQFIVCKDGTVCDIKTINNVPDPLKKEAERLIATSKEWLPAEQGGRMVKAYRKQPITLHITYDE